MVVRHLALALCAVLVAASSVLAQSGATGASTAAVVFPTSASSPEAQQHFLRGVTFLHSFGWKQAIAELRAAQKIEPDFALAYWAETLAYNHPITPEQDNASPRAVLTRLGATREERRAKAPTAREKALLDSVEILWGSEGDWRARRVAYMRALEGLHQSHSGDDEVAAFYSLSLLAGGRALEDTTFQYQMKAGAIALDILARKPRHPGAVHYAIHAFDDPVHAPLGLPAAHVYAQIVPDVAHAIHMSTHIFIQHGLWKEVADQNLRAYQVALDLWRPGDSPGDMVHPLDWRHYAALQRTDQTAAQDAVARFEQIAAQSKHPRARQALELVRARHIIETEQWAVLPRPEDASAETWLAAGISAARTGDLATATNAAARLSVLADRAVAKAVAGGGVPSEHDHGAGGGATGQPALPAGLGGDEARSIRTMEREVAGLVALTQGRHDEAVAILREAVRNEEAMTPPNGAATPIKPSHELLGEVLLELGKPVEAAEAFEATLRRMPNRALALRGAVKAYQAAGRADLAAARRQVLLAVWEGRRSVS